MHGLFAEMDEHHAVYAVDAADYLRALLRRCLLYTSADFDGPVYIRLANGRNEPEVYKGDYEFRFGKGIELMEGSYGYIVACGIMLAYAVEAAKQLRAEGLDVGVIDMHRCV